MPRWRSQVHTTIAATSGAAGTRYSTRSHGSRARSAADWVGGGDDPPHAHPVRFVDASRRGPADRLEPPRGERLVRALGVFVREGGVAVRDGRLDREPGMRLLARVAA